jgi:hypothetical protein
VIVQDCPQVVVQNIHAAHITVVWTKVAVHTRNSTSNKRWTSTVVALKVLVHCRDTATIKISNVTRKVDENLPNPHTMPTLFYHLVEYVLRKHPDSIMVPTHVKLARYVLFTF